MPQISSFIVPNLIPIGYFCQHGIGGEPGFAGKQFNPFEAGYPI